METDEVNGRKREFSKWKTNRRLFGKTFKRIQTITTFIGLTTIFASTFTTHYDYH